MRRPLLAVVTATVVLAAPGAAQAGDTIVALQGPSIVTFDSDTPQTPFGAAVPITGLPVGHSPRALARRAADGAFFLVTVDSSDNGFLYTLNRSTGVATAVGSGFGAAASIVAAVCTPTADRVRIIGYDRRNARIRPDTGAFFAEDNLLTYAAGDPRAGVTPVPYSIAYDRLTPGATAATAYVIDHATASPALARVGGVDGAPSASGGVLTTIGTFTAPGSIVRDDFDIAPSGRGYHAVATVPPVSTQIYEVDLESGAAQSRGLIAGATGALTALPGSAFSVSGATTVAEGATASLQVARTGTATGAATVRVTTADAGASDADYTPVDTVLTFADGETSKTVAIATTQDATAEDAEPLVVTLSQPRGNKDAGAVVGTPGTGVVTIADDDTPPPAPVTTTVTTSVPAAPDTTAPTVTLGKLSSSITRKSLLKGLSVKVTVSESSSLTATLQGSVETVKLAKHELALATATAKLGTGTRTLKLKPSSKLLPKLKKSVSLRLRVEARDAAGNLKAVTKTLTVKP